MINNSALRKWDRLAQKQLDNQFMYEMTHGLECSPFEATAILDSVYKVFQPFFETSGTLRPGQFLCEVIAADQPPQVRLAAAKMVTVTLTLDAGQEDLDVRRASGVPGLRQHRMQRMAVEAFQQGGLLTFEDLANRILNCGERTLTRDMEYLKKEGVMLPLRCTIKDMGRTISHRELIIKEWLLGKEYSEISRNTNHSIPSVQNYVSKFKRVVALLDEGYEINTIAFLVKVSADLAELYYRLYKEVAIVPHRREELEMFLKKRASETVSRRLK